MGKNNMKMKEIAVVVFGLSAFILNSVLRNSVMVFWGHSFPDINYLCILVLICGLIVGTRRRFIKRKTCYCWGMVLLYVLSIMVSNIINGNKVGLNVLCFSLFPAFLFIILFYNQKYNFENIFVVFLKIYNIVVGTILLLGILDYFIGGRINNILAMHFSSPSWAKMIITENLTFGYRMCTIIGSPLMNAFFALAYIVLNNINNCYRENKKWIILVIDMFGLVAIVLTGSRVALLLGVFFVFVSLMKGAKSIKKILILICTLIFLTYFLTSDFFQNTIGVRFANNLAVDGRFKMLENAIEGEYGAIGILTGGGYNYSRILTSAGAAATQNFELPLLMFLFDYGVFATIIYYVFFGLFPCVMLIRNKNYYELLGYIMLFLHLNSSNILAQKYDFNLMLGFIIVVIINLKTQEGIEDWYRLERIQGGDGLVQ